MMSKIYGVRHIGIYCPIIQVSDDGFIHENKQYKWEDIIVLKREDDVVTAFLTRTPSTTILLKDSSIIRIPTTVEEKGKAEWSKFRLFAYKNEAYDELTNLLEAKFNRVSSPLEKNVITRSYIYLYNFLIVVGLVLLSFLPITSWIGPEGLDIVTARLFVVVSSVIIAIGLGMYVWRIKSEKYIRNQLLNKKS